MKDENCIFCKILAGDIPSYQIYEDDDFKVILDVGPEILGCDGYNLVQNNGEVAGQTVDHFHLHLIPRYEGDDARVGWNPGSLDPSEAEELMALIKSDPAFS